MANKKITKSEKYKKVMSPITFVYSFRLLMPLEMIKILTEPLIGIPEAFYKGKKVLVIGGGNSGFEEGLFLTKFADQVDIVEFLPEVKASQILQESVSRNEKMTVTVNHAVKEFIGENTLETILVENRSTGEVEEWDYDGVFVFIGLTPNSDLVKDMVEVNDYGFIETDKTLMTSQNGIFASGDIRADSTKQAAAAAGEGVTVAMMIRQYLKEVG